MFKFNFFRKAFTVAIKDELAPETRPVVHNPEIEKNIRLLAYRPHRVMRRSRNEMFH
ncbi:MAG: hypothetical protein JO154_01460 [Chitinophaga sp.]|uniref:hypothetical protein n=1 Tax=Chitinophaga sp. TaxID=1869181 RepID=UPI0025C6121A|nr:hypothetical protein [Chitinophaga sp.]MBV8251245.1 hypothetical protein [Chitinophaga sp.]